MDKMPIGKQWQRLWRSNIVMAIGWIAVFSALLEQVLANRGHPFLSPLAVTGPLIWLIAIVLGLAVGPGMPPSNELISLAKSYTFRTYTTLALSAGVGIVAALLIDGAINIDAARGVLFVGGIVYGLLTGLIIHSLLMLRVEPSSLRR